MTSEANIQQLIRLAASEAGVVLHRNNIGAYKDPRGYFVRYGVGGNGGSDLIGWRKHHGIAQFIAVEVKTATGKATKEQLNFIQLVFRALRCG